MTYTRAWISGHLTCVSALHIGDGDQALFAQRPGVEQHVEQPQGGYNTVIRDIDDRPVIPGSSLRGVVLEGIDRSSQRIKDLLGFASEKLEVSQAEYSKSSRIRFNDAGVHKVAREKTSTLPFWDKDKGTYISHGIALDPVIGSVGEGLLFRYEMVPEDTVFSVCVEADDLEEDQIQWLVALLQGFDGSADKSLGRGRSKGYGRMRFSLDKIEVLSEADFTAWLDEPADTPLPRKTLEIGLAQDKTGEGAFSPKLHIRSTSPLLVNEPGYVSVGKQKPNLHYSRDKDGKARIPATSLKGMLRGQARRILGTILHTNHDDLPLHETSGLIDPLLDRLFGGTRFRSPLWFGDAVATTKTTTHKQFFNAVDRFTGGVKDEALFNVVAADVEWLQASIEWERDRLPSGDGWKGLLILLLRDAMEGQLAVGWGKAKGYGAIDIELEWEKGNTLESWETVLEFLEHRGHDKGKIRGWIEALHREIDDTCEKHRAGSLTDKAG